MAKTLKNGLSMIETNPLNHNWSHFVILSGLTLHQFKKKLLLSLKPRYLLFLYTTKVQEQNKYEKNRQNLRNSDLEVCCTNIQPRLKNLRSFTKNHSFFIDFGGFLKVSKYWLNISALTYRFIYRIYFWGHRWHPCGCTSKP